MRIFGYILGILSNGIMTASTPRRWTDLTVHTTERFMPPEQTGVIEEFASLSPGAMRYWGFVESALGVAVLALASRVGGRMRHPA